jgi:hypothetical protein
MVFLASCITTTNVHYSDPNYLGSDEFSTYDEITENNQERSETITTDTGTTANNYDGDYYEADDYYDYSFSSRIRRFHRPMYSTGYYGGIYTDYYWYNNDPFYCGTSIYYGYNWNYPYYSYYSYSPYYYDYYYTPYYTGGYYSYYGYGYNHHHHYNQNNITVNTNNNHTYITGHRGSLSSRGGRGVQVNATNNTIIPNTNSNTSTLNIRTTNNSNKSTIKTNSISTSNTTIKNNTNRNKTNYKANNRNNRTVKTNNKNNSTNRSNSTIRTNSGNRSYSAPKTNNRNQSSGNRRSVKPRK